MTASCPGLTLAPSNIPALCRYPWRAGGVPQVEGAITGPAGPEIAPRFCSPGPLPPQLSGVPMSKPSSRFRPTTLSGKILLLVLAPLGVVFLGALLGLVPVERSAARGGASVLPGRAYPFHCWPACGNAAPPANLIVSSGCVLDMVPSLCEGYGQPSIGPPGSVVRRTSGIPSRKLG